MKKASADKDQSVAGTKTVSDANNEGQQTGKGKVLVDKEEQPVVKKKPSATQKIADKDTAAAIETEATATDTPTALPKKDAQASDGEPVAPVKRKKKPATTADGQPIKRKKKPATTADGQPVKRKKKPAAKPQQSSTTAAEITLEENSSDPTKTTPES